MPVEILFLDRCIYQHLAIIGKIQRHKSFLTTLGHVRVSVSKRFTINI